jgi:polar amino acid transport system substrate-binding protein
MRYLLAVVACALALCGPLRPAAAEDLQTILDHGVIRIGTQLDTPPFGSIDASGKPVGFDVEYGAMLGKALGVKVELVQIIGANRIPFLLSNKIDVVVSAMGATPQRAAQVMFTTPYVNLYLGVYGPKSRTVHGPADLGSLKIALTKGTTQDQAMTDAAPKANIIRFDDDTTSNTAFLSGQADLWATMNTVAGSVAERSPERGIELKFKLRPSPGHMAVGQGDFALLQWLNTFIFVTRINGELARLHHEWLKEDVGELPIL